MDAPPHDDDNLLPLSALQHLVYCERQCALIHLEGVWAENRLTVEGGRLHRRVHDRPEVECPAGLRLARQVRLRSLRLGLSGIADVVEFHPVGENAVPHEPDAGTVLPGVAGRWRPFPVEYKRGRPKRNRCDEVQLCAQALCLEEMLGTAVLAGALFYGRTRRRKDVSFDSSLRRTTEDAADRLHRLFDARTTPPAEVGPRCRNCSLKDACLPKVARDGPSAAAFLDRAIARALAAGPDAEGSP